MQFLKKLTYVAFFLLFLFYPEKVGEDYSFDPETMLINKTGRAIDWFIFWTIEKITLSRKKKKS